MKNILLNFVVWFLILLVSWEATSVIYNYVTYPLYESSIVSGGFELTIIHLITILLIGLVFVFAGFLFSYRVGSHPQSVSLCMSVGVVWLAIELGLGHPSQFMYQVSHPDLMDKYVWFATCIVPAFGCALGAILFSKLRVLRNHAI